MRNHLSRLGTKALLLAGTAAVTMASAAWAGGWFVGPLNDNSCGPPNKRLIENATTAVPTGPVPLIRSWTRGGAPLDKCLTGIAANDSMVFTVLHCDATCDAHVIVTMAYFPKNYFVAGSKEEYRGPFVYAKNGAGGPPLMTSLLPDSLSSCFGLYSGGGIPNLNLSSAAGNDSVMSTYVTRDNANNTVLVETSKGGLQTCALTGSQQSFSELMLVVYPNTVAAVNDPSGEGKGAIFFAKAVLSGPSGLLYTYGSTTTSDWIVTQSNGKWTARPKPGLQKLISVANDGFPGANADSAVVRVTGDARSAQNVPGQSPLVLALMALALLGSGVWVIRSRRTTAAA